MAVNSILPLIMVVIILVGMSSGLFTPTEAAAVALAYALVITTFLYKPIPLKKFYELSVVLLLSVSPNINLEVPESCVKSQCKKIFFT